MPMTTQAAAAAPGGGAAANGSAAAAPGASVVVKKEASPAADGKGGGAAAAGSRGGTPAAADGKGSPAPAGGAAAARGTPEAGAAAEPAEPTPEDEEQRRLEDEILAEGRAIAGVRALLARAFGRPAEEPAVPTGHWGFLLREAMWLANDMAQERLWKQAAAMAIGYEVARLKGKFGLRPPPEGQRQYSAEIAAARAAAAKDAGERPGRRSAKAAAAAAEPNGAAALRLDPADDPVFADLEGHESLSWVLAPGSQPGTPPSTDGGGLVFQHDGALQAALEAHLLEADTARLMREEMAAREYRFEYDAALASHHMAVQEQNRRAMRLDADMADADGLAPLDEEGGEDEEGARAKGRKRARGGYLLDDFAGLGGADETESVGAGAPKARAANRQFIEDTYLQRKRRRDRYKDVDVDYDVGMEAAGRYGTRATRALATRAGATRAQDPAKRKQAMGRADSFAAGGAGGLAVRGGTRLPPGGVPGPVIWSKPEDDLLLAITHEFGVNWTMVSEVLSLSLSMQGVFRPPHLCKQRFRQITTPLLQQAAAAAAAPGAEVAQVDYGEDKALAALCMAMSKQQARELIVASLPVHDDVMMRMLEALVQVGATAKQRRALEEKRTEAGRKAQDAHPSHGTVRAAVLAKTGGKHLTPQELAVQVDVAYAQQAKQHQMLQQQAQQAAQLQAQQAAAPPPPGQQQGGGGGQPGTPQPGAVQGSGQPGGGPAQGMPAAGQAIAAGTPAGPPGLQAQGGQQHGAPTPPLPSPGGAPGGGGGPPMQSPAGVVGQPPAPRPAQPQITLQQLNHILETGKLPNGQPLEPQMRKAIEDKRAAYMAQLQQRQMQQAMLQQQAAAGGGQPSAATQAALHAAQQAAAVQGMRPPMGMQGVFRPGVPGGGMGMQQQQQQLMAQQMAQMAAAGGQPGMQMQAGMQLPPGAQQQLMAQQYAMQQQQAAAAAAQQQAAAAAAAQHGQGGG